MNQEKKRRLGRGSTIEMRPKYDISIFQNKKNMK